MKPLYLVTLCFLLGVFVSPSAASTDVVLVLSDINMPGMTGLELRQRIKSDPPPVPVCMMTAYDNEEYRGKAADLECDGYVSKPIDFAALKEKIASFRST